MLETRPIECEELKCPRPECKEHILDYVLWDEDGNCFVSYTKGINVDGRVYGQTYHRGEVIVCPNCHVPFRIEKEGEIKPTYEQLEEKLFVIDRRMKFYEKAQFALNKIDSFLRFHRRRLSYKQFWKIRKECRKEQGENDAGY